MSDLILQIDQGLGRYYALLGDKSYFNKDGVGKFQFHCDESSLDDDEAINDELKEDPSDCMLTDFDKQFPFSEEPDDRAIAIFKIIQKCATDPGAYKNFNMLYQPAELKPKDYELSEEDKKEAKDWYTRHCPSIFGNNALSDAAFMKFTAISHKLNTPYFQSVADMYQRARVTNADNPDYDLNDWMNNVNNKLVYELKNMSDGQMLQEALLGALRSYSSRVFPALMFSPNKVIVDSLADICADIAKATDFVAKLTLDEDFRKETSCPFQFDVIFAFNEAKEVTAVVSPKQNGQDDDGDGDDDDEDDDDDEKNDVKNEFYDVFGDVKKKLTLAKLLFLAFPLDEDDEKADGSWDKDDDEKEKDPDRVNMFWRGFRKFTADKIENKYKGKEKKEYPRNFRFNALVDRRKPDREGNKGKNILDKDELIFFEPPSNANKLPQEQAGRRSPMPYFNASRTVLIPPGGDVNGDQKKKDMAKEITSLSACKGGMMALSFHVESADEIRCYLSLNGQCIRFMPRDIIDVLPLFFDSEHDGNKNWKKSKEAMELVEQIEKNLIDRRFNAFLSKYQPKPNFINFIR